MEGDVDVTPLDNIRKLVTPKQKCRAKIYNSLINWMNELKAEPTYISSLLYQQVNVILETRLIMSNWPNSTQAIERRIKVMTEAYSEVTGYKARDGYSRQSLMENDN